ncbi:MAG TPA: FCD domain-containing protein [Dongiaceae bacterium]|nr:FCD domain-containing protein [Dongiaceae bacterium]
MAFIFDWPSLADMVLDQNRLSRKISIFHGKNDKISILVIFIVVFLSGSCMVRKIGEKAVQVMTLIQNGQNSDDPTGKASGKTIIENVFARLRSEILNGVLAPESRLRVEELRSRFGVASSTVREALSRLLADNLVTTEGQRGFKVAPVSLADFREIATMRMLLEAKAVRESIANGDDEWESRVVAAAHRLSKVEAALAGNEWSAVNDWEARNREFHNALVSGCDNRWLLNFREILYNHSVRYLRISLTERTIPRDVRSEHQAIFEAVIARKADLAERLTIDHIAKSVTVIEARVAGLKVAS